MPATNNPDPAAPALPAPVETFALFDAAGLPLAFYSTDVWDASAIPVGAVEISADQRAEFLQHPGRRAWLGGSVQPYTAPARPDPVPPSISRRQFYQQLALAGTISQAEALAAVKTGEIPSILIAIVDELPAADRFGAEMLLAGAASFERAHPLTATIAAAPSVAMTAAQTDQFFIAASKL